MFSMPGARLCISKVPVQAIKEIVVNCLRPVTRKVFHRQLVEQHASSTSNGTADLGILERIATINIDFDYNHCLYRVICKSRPYRKALLK